MGAGRKHAGSRQVFGKLQAPRVAHGDHHRIEHAAAQKIDQFAPARPKPKADRQVHPPQLPPRPPPRPGVVMAFGHDHQHRLAPRQVNRIPLPARADAAHHTCSRAVPMLTPRSSIDRKAIPPREAAPRRGHRHPPSSRARCRPAGRRAASGRSPSDASATLSASRTTRSWRSEVEVRRLRSTRTSSTRMAKFEIGSPSSERRGIPSRT